MIHNLFLTLFVGALFRRELKSGTFVGIPKVAPWFMVGCPLWGFFCADSYNIPFLAITGLTCIAIGLIGFGYPVAFGTKPKTPKL